MATLIANVDADLQPNGGTSGAIDTTGANFIAVSVNYLVIASVGAVGALSDSKGNSWSSAVISNYVNGDVSIRTHLFYAANANVGSGHTFSIASAAVDVYPCLFVQAWSGMSGSPFPSVVASSNGAFSVSSMETGTISPVIGDLEILSMAVTSPAASPISVSGSYSTYTVTDEVVTVDGIGGAMAYSPVVVDGAQFGTWSFSGTNAYGACLVARFKTASGAATWPGYMAPFGWN